MTITAQDLVGAWTLVDFRIEFEDGREPYAPFGEDAVGQIIYSDGGRMSAVLSRANRNLLSVEKLERSARAPEEEKAAAFDSYLSYGGSYRVEDGHVVHLVEHALMPNLVGREQRREAVLDGDRLTLTYVVETSRGAHRYILRWERDR